MGLFDFFKSRRQKESAFSPSVDQSTIGEAGVAPGQTGFEGGAISDIKNMWNISQQLQQAMKQGNFQVTQGEAATIDARGSEELREAILKTLRENGIDAQKGQTVQVTDPKAMQAIFKTLSEHSDDLGHMQQQAMAAFGGLGGAGAIGGVSGADATVSNLERLQHLREQGVLSQDEFEKQKRKLLGQ